MKNNHKKSLLAIVLAALLLTVCVSGTLAFLVDRTQPVVNAFTPAQVDITVDSTNYTITNENEDKNVDAYVRAAVLVNWKSGNNVFGQPPTCTWKLGDGWQKSGDFYYYTKKLAVGKTTSALVEEFTKGTETAPAEDYELTVEILAQAIQAEGTDVDGKKPVVQAWGVDPEVLGQ